MFAPLKKTQKKPVFHSFMYFATFVILVKNAIFCSHDTFFKYLFLKLYFYATTKRMVGDYSKVRVFVVKGMRKLGQIVD